MPLLVRINIYQQLQMHVNTWNISVILISQRISIDSSYEVSRWNSSAYYQIEMLQTGRMRKMLNL